MRGPRSSALALVLLVAGAGPVRADDYLEDPYPREGLMLGVGVGGAAFVGGGEYGDLQVAGGAGVLRVGTRANRMVTFLLQSEGMAFRGEDPVTRELSTQALAINTFGVMLFVRERFWVRTGLGLASLSQDDRQGRDLDNGLGLTGALGYDVRRWHRWALNLELGSASGVMGDGTITLFFARLGATYY